MENRSATADGAPLQQQPTRLPPAGGVHGPEVAGAGLTTAEAGRRGVPVDVVNYDLGRVAGAVR
jgi:hypothetical protein